MGACAVTVIWDGLVGPLLARYMSELLRLAGPSQVTVTAQAPSPADGLYNYVGQVSQTGVIVVVVVAAGALAFDARRGVSIFLRSRTRHLRDLVVPRYVMSVAAAVAGYTVGTAAAWYETALLIGPLPAAEMAQGWVCAVVYLAYAVAVVVLAASLARSVLGTVGTALAMLLFTPVLGTVAVVRPWLPSTLANAPVELLGPAVLGDYVRTLAVAVVLGLTFLVVGVRRLGAREL